VTATRPSAPVHDSRSSRWWLGVGIRGWDREKWRRLRSHPLFERCSVTGLRRVASVTDEITVAAGHTLTQQGRPARWFFAIHSGQAEVTRDGVRLAVLGPGDHFGEVAVLAHGMQPATVRALTPMTLFVVGCQRFIPLVQDLRCLRRDMEAALARQPRLVALAREERSRRVHAVSLAPLAPSPPPVARDLVSLARPFVPLRVETVIRPDPVPRRTVPFVHRRALLATFVAAVVAPIALVATLYHPPVEVIVPGPVVDVSQDITISGVTAHRPRGRYLLITVRSERPSLLGIGRALLHGNRTVQRLRPRTDGLDSAAVHDELAREFVQSRMAAARAAARAEGLPIGPDGRLPFAIHFRDRDVIGPSGGLIYALAIDDMLSADDRAHGRSIAATGEIDSTGIVSAIGYPDEKAAAAHRAGAQLLLVPRDQLDEATGHGVRVEGVGSLQQARDDLVLTLRSRAT